MHKTIGGATLNWQELSEVILDIEIQINRRPLCYTEDDVRRAPNTYPIHLFVSMIEPITRARALARGGEIPSKASQILSHLQEKPMEPLEERVLDRP